MVPKSVLNTKCDRTDDVQIDLRHAPGNIRSLNLTLWTGSIRKACGVSFPSAWCYSAVVKQESRRGSGGLLRIPIGEEHSGQPVGAGSSFSLEEEDVWPHERPIKARRPTSNLQQTSNRPNSWGHPWGSSEASLIHSNSLYHYVQCVFSTVFF